MLLIKSRATTCGVSTDATTIPTSRPRTIWFTSSAARRTEPTAASTSRARVEHSGPGGGQARGPAGPVDQLDAELTFQLLTCALTPD